MGIEWIPGKAIDFRATERMKQHFPKPGEAPGEAWFNTLDRIFNTWLLELSPDQYDVSELEHYLKDTGGGIKNFGRFEEWVVWFHYLLPHLLSRILEGEFLPLTLTYFLNLYPDEIVEEYHGFRHDIFRTIPQALMSADLWQNDDLAKNHWWYDEWAGYWYSSFNTTMFFCLKSLTPAEMDNWVGSIAEIKGKHWRECVRKWLENANRFFDYIKHPEKLPDTDKAKESISKLGIGGYLEIADIDWLGFYLVFSGVDLGVNKRTRLSDYLAEANIDAFWVAVRKYNLEFQTTDT